MKMPLVIVEKFEKASQGIDYGTVTLTLFVKQGRHRYIVAREESYIPDEELSTRDDLCANEKRTA